MTGGMRTFLGGVKKSFRDWGGHFRARAVARLAGFEGQAPVGKVAFNALPVAGSWGGGNQWLLQLSRYLRFLGFTVVYDLSDSDIDFIFVLHSADSQGGTFGAEEIAAYKRAHPRARCIHRINENDARKGTDFMDRAIARMNEVADHTVFISDWLRAHHAERWFDSRRPHSVITNGADSRFFQPFHSQSWRGGDAPLVLVTHHWSDHWNKGFKVYQEVDALIADGKLPGTELWVIGRWPKEIQWRAARTFSPCAGEELASRLRAAHIYITASQAEPGGMHFIEGIQCGLPLLFHSGGGGIVEVGAASGGIEFSADVAAAITRARQNYAELRRRVLTQAPTGEQMVAEFAGLLRKLESER